MRPLADLLVSHSAQGDTILNVAHIPDRDLSHVVRLAELDRLAAGFMQDVPLLAMQFRTGPRLAFHEFAMALRAGFGAGDQGGEFRMSFVAQTLDRSQRPPAHYQAVPGFGSNCRDIDLAQVHPGHLPALFQGRVLHPAVYGQAQLVVIDPPGELNLANIRTHILTRNGQ